jgi:hypothetical protein
MNEPTQNKEERHNSPSANAEVHDRTGLYLAIIALIFSALSLGINIDEGRHVTDRERDVNNKLIISENHWRDIEVAQKTAQAEIERLKEELSHVKR